MITLKCFFVLLTFLNILCPSSCHLEDDVSYYENMIFREMEKARNYELPTDSRDYMPTNEDPIDFGTFHFIVVGVGSSGSVIASRLSEVPEWSILALEAGDFGNDFTAIPRMGYDVNVLSDYNWGYYSTPQSTSCLGRKGNRCAYVRGKGVGGTSLLDPVTYARGNRIDYDMWCGVSNSSWCYDDVLPYFLKSEDYHKTDRDALVLQNYHNFGGLLRVDHPMPRSGKCYTFFQANSELGLKYTDPNGPFPMGMSPLQVNVKHGMRQDAGTAFLKPLLDIRPNLMLLTGCFVMRVTFNEAREADGVVFSHEGRLYRARAGREVVVSAGAINSPQLLMLSGIGPKEHLQEVGIPILQDLEVGSNLYDHVQFGLTFSSNLSEPFPPLREQIRQYIEGYGPQTTTMDQEGVGYYMSPMEMIFAHSDLEILFHSSNSKPYALNKAQDWEDDVATATEGVQGPGSFDLHISLLHTKSSGSVRLNSASPFDYPLVDSNSFSNPEGRDIETGYRAVIFALNLINTTAFARVNAKLETKPLEVCLNESEYMSREYWYCALRYIGGHGNQPAGSCRMGPDPDADDVVDEMLRVHGVKNLRVGDASVIPISTTGYVGTVSYMIGEKLADLLKAEYGVYT